MDFFSMLLERATNPSSGGGEDLMQYVKTARTLFHSVKSFSSKGVANLPNVYDVYQAFAYWNTEPIPIVEELTVNAPNINVSNNQACMGQMFHYNYGVKKVVLNMPDESQYMRSTFSNAKNLEEVVLNFSTENIQDYNSTFGGCNALKRIIGVLDFSSATGVAGMFQNCIVLEEVTFAPNTLSISISLGHSGVLTSESIQSIIDGLAKVETAQTLTLNSNVLSKLTDEQWSIAEEKNWIIS